MFSFNTIVASTRRQLCQYIFADPVSSSVIKASALPLLSIDDRFVTTFHDQNQTQFGSEDHTRIKCDSLIEKYRFSPTDLAAEQFHSEIIKNGFAGDLFMCNTLINVYARNGDMASAANVFDEMPERNSVTWACLVSGYLQNHIPDSALTAFRRMVSEGLVPSHYAIASTLRACQGLGVEGLRNGIQIHGMVSKTCYAADVVVCNVLISMYGHCCLGTEGSDCAWRVFDWIRNKNSVSWNSIISVYSQRGDVDSAFRLFSCMQREGIGFSFMPTEYTFGSLITVSTESLDAGGGLLLLEQLLAKIQASGFVEDLYVGSALVSGFARLGNIDTAKSIFQLMGTINAVSVNGLMVGFMKLHLGEEAVEVFLETMGQIRLNCDSYVLLLTSFGEFSDLENGKRKGKEVHGYLTRTGMNNSIVSVGNSLINMYAKCGAVEDSLSVFKLMTNKDSVSWSSLISGFDRNDWSEDAISSFRMMKRVGLLPSNFTLISTLSSCSRVGLLRTGEQVHCEAVKLGLDQDVSVSNTLLLLYADTGCITNCRKVFSSMHNRDEVSWNSVIRAFSDSETYAVEATEYFREMSRFGLYPNNVTVINILSAAASLSSTELANQVHALAVKHRLTDDNAVLNAILTCYGKCGEINSCEGIFSRMQERDDISWNAMISGYIHSELLAKAMNMVWLLLHSGQRLDSFTFATILSACASVATLEHGMEVHACATRSCLVSDVVIGSALVDMYAKCGRIDYASRFFESMPLRNVYTWNSMISGYARHGDGLKALAMSTRMKLENQSPDHVTFVGVLSACSHMGLVTQGFDHFESMKNVYGLTPRIEHYACMVDLLGRASKFEKLEKFIDEMPIKPNILMWRTVLAACGRANGHLLDLGKRAAQRILELEPQNATNYVLLANMYASGEKWEHVAKARHAMKTADARKEAGCSWVAMKDGIRVFVSGDKSHHDTDLIYDKLRELHAKMKAAGYVPQIKYALYDLEEENREELLSNHSERLAVAFVLTRESERPIRIMKNLRVCGDCHLAFNYISRIVGRLIVLRDSHRFHHFMDGKCSCNDYW